MAKYKVGDLVKVVNLTRYSSDPGVTPTMTRCVGKVGEITEIFNHNGRVSYELLFRSFPLGSGYNWDERWVISYAEMYLSKRELRILNALNHAQV